MMDHVDLWILLVVAVVCWLDARRERRQAYEDAAAMRGKWDLARLDRDTWRGQA